MATRLIVAGLLPVLLAFAALAVEAHPVWFQDWMDAKKWLCNKARLLRGAGAEGYVDMESTRRCT